MIYKRVKKKTIWEIVCEFCTTYTNQLAGLGVAAGGIAIRLLTGDGTLMVFGILMAIFSLLPEAKNDKNEEES